MTDAGGCYWRYKYRLGGKEKVYAIGTINDFTLAEAREEHDRARKCVLAGNDPVEMRRKDEANEETARQAAGSFREIARNVRPDPAAVASTKDRAQHAIKTLMPCSTARPSPRSPLPTSPRCCASMRRQASSQPANATRRAPERSTPLLWHSRIVQRCARISRTRNAATACC